MDNHITVRFAELSDAAELALIYRPYVLETAVTFEYEAPSAEEFRNRIKHTRQKYPYLVAETEREIVGYAYAGSFSARAAYDWSVETTIYIRRGSGRRGIGRKLYAALERVLEEMHIYNLNACIASSETEDEYLTQSSVSFHARLGYARVGEFHQCGYKFQRWYNMVWMEKMLGARPKIPESVVNVNEISGMLKKKYQIT